MHKLLSISVLLVVLASCKNKEAQKIPGKEELIELNRVAAKKEAIQIQRFVDDKQWATTKTGSGLHYYIYQPGTGDSARSGQMATVKMTVTLLNGDTCYSWEAYGTEDFIIDHDHNESGLHEGIKFMRVGDKAKIILPSHLAFGVSGDHDRIPPKHSVVYDIELVGLK